ncbi:endolytic transglycosylase MltG [Aerococcaceae bacterium DSM 111022]|nr:endolytic transglycosylase MltG [Aerococcaceae bacterium DSM 111022]
MSDNKWHELREEAKKEETKDAKLQLWTNRIVRYIILAIVLIVLVIGVSGYFYVQNALSPVNESNQEMVEVTIPVGSNASDIAGILDDAGVVNNAQLFDYYLKFNNNEELQAGHYEFNQSMDAAGILQTLQEGGEPIFVDADTTITVIEGMQLTEIAAIVDENTAITSEEFMDVVSDEAFIQELETQFPSMLAGLSDIEGLNYTLEGYLFPATYDYFAGMSAQELITEMIAASNNVYQSLIADLEYTYLSFDQVLTLASIVEREAVTQEDRQMVSGVFYNRLEVGMPLQSDITVLYALGEHKEFVTYSDLEVDSPYNTYMYDGLPPGPINSPSLMSIESVIYPEWNNFYYFVADLDTGEVYYSSTIEEHDALVEEYVNSRQESIENAEESSTNEEISDTSAEESAIIEESVVE